MEMFQIEEDQRNMKAEYNVGFSAGYFLTKDIIGKDGEI